VPRMTSVGHWAVPAASSSGKGSLAASAGWDSERMHAVVGGWVVWSLVLLRHHLAHQGKVRELGRATAYIGLQVVPWDSS